MKTKYFCEKCGSRYNTAEEAEKCEAQHGHIVVAHIIPGEVYSCGALCPDEVYVKFRNYKGEEKAAKYGFACYENVDFEAVKKIYE